MFEPLITRYMPKVLEYPRASFLKVLELAQAVDSLGGSCTQETCAEKLNRTVSGAFNALIGAGLRHGLITSKNNTLTLTDSYKKIKLAYDEEEKKSALKESFFAAPIYVKLYEKFKNREVPSKLLGKILIREYGVDESMASRVAGYFMEGVNYLGLLVEGKLADSPAGTIVEASGVVVQDENRPLLKQSSNREFTTFSTLDITENESSQYKIHIFGPGMDTKLTIAEDDDFLILDAFLAKLKKKIKDN